MVLLQLCLILLCRAKHRAKYMWIVMTLLTTKLVNLYWWSWVSTILNWRASKLFGNVSLTQLYLLIYLSLKCLCLQFNLIAFIFFLISSITLHTLPFDSCKHPLYPGNMNNFIVKQGPPHLSLSGYVHKLDIINKLACSFVWWYIFIQAIGWSHNSTHAHKWRQHSEGTC